MNDNDYLVLLLNGYTQHSNYLSDYIYRECLNAKEKHIEADEFFERCYNVIEGFEADLDRQLHKWKYPYYLLIEQEREKGNDKKADEAEARIKKMSRENFTVHLVSYTNNQFRFPLYYNQILFIKKSIDLAQSKWLGIELEKLKELGEKRLKEISEKDKLRKRLTKIHSYKWEKYSISKLFNSVKEKLIDKDTTKENFSNVFSEKPVKEISPVKWHDGNASELLYFITQMMENGCITKEKRMNYNRLKGCFVKNDGKPFTENFKELKQSLDISLSPEKTKFIDKILQKLTA